MKLLNSLFDRKVSRVSPQRRHAIVIGAGLGGIAAALRARALGFEVTVVERLEQIGGRARVFRRDGYTFDAGPTVITAPILLEELFALFGERLSEHVELLPVDPWYRITFPDGSHFKYGSTAEELRQAVLDFSPEDIAGYDQFMKRARALFEIGFETYGDKPFHRPLQMLRALPMILRYGGYLSVYDMVSRFIRNESLRRILSLQPLLVGGHPYHTSAIYALIPYLEQRFGIWFARGGTAALIAALGKLMARQNINVLTKSTVESIMVKDKRAVGVVLAGGQHISAEVVIANVDPPALYKHLLPTGKRRVWTDQRLSRLQYSMGLFVLYFGTNLQYPNTAHHTIILGQHYRELLDEVFGHSAILPEDLSLYLHRPTATDPTLAPPGHDAFYALAPVPNLQADIDWGTASAVLTKRILAMLSERELPEVEQHITTCFHLNPVDFSHDYLSEHGAGFSIAPTLRQSGYFRFHNLSEEAENLYLVGAGTHPGAGVPGVLSSAKVVEHLLREEIKA